MTDTPYTTPTALKTRYPSLAAISNQDLADLVTEFEQWVEACRGVAYVTRTATGEVIEKFTGSRFTTTHPQVIAVTAITATDLYTGGAVSSPLPAPGDLLPDGRGFVWPGAFRWLPSWRVTITYTHGHSTMPAGILRGCNLFVRNEATEAAGTFPANARNVTNDATGFSYALSSVDTAAGRPSRWMDVMAAVDPVPDERPVLVA